MQNQRLIPGSNPPPPNRKKLPAPPNPPPTRMIHEASHWAACPKCGSTMMRRKWIFFGESPGCIQPQCANSGAARDRD